MTSPARNPHTYAADYPPAIQRGTSEDLRCSIAELNAGVEEDLRKLGCADIDRRTMKSCTGPIEAPFGWFGAVLMAFAVICVYGLLQERDIRIEKAARAEDAAKVKTYRDMLATCPATDPKADTVIAFFKVTGGDIVFEHCVPMRPKTSYSPATRSLIGMIERQTAVQ